MMHLLTPWPAEPLGDHVPDLVIMWRRVEPWMFPPAGRQPIWWNDEIAVYAPDGALAPIMPPPPDPEPPPVAVRVSGVRAADGRIAFTAAFDDRAPEQWTGQEWVLVLGDGSPWAIPMHVDPGGRTLGSVAWFPGQVAPGMAANAFAYEFDILAPSLAVRDEDGAFTPAAGSAPALGAGAWTLAVRLRHEWQPNYWRQAGFIPVLRVSVSDAGEIAYEVFDDVRRRTASLGPGAPARPRAGRLRRACVTRMAPCGRRHPVRGGHDGTGERADGLDARPASLAHERFTHPAVAAGGIHGRKPCGGAVGAG